jgi:hypothetical protein
MIEIDDYAGTNEEPRIAGVVEAAIMGMFDNGFIPKEAEAVKDISAKLGIDPAKAAEMRLLQHVAPALANRLGYVHSGGLTSYPIPSNPNLVTIPEPDPSVREHLNGTTFRKPFFYGPPQVQQILLSSGQLKDAYVGAVLQSIVPPKEQAYTSAADTGQAMSAASKSN